MSENILDLIDGAIARDGDAMRWRPPDELAAEAQAREDLAARYADYLELARAQSSPVRLTDQRAQPQEPGEALTTDSTPPARIHPGTPVDLSYRRHCPNCNARTVPRLGVVARIPALGPYWATHPDPDAVIDVRQETAHVCSRCLAPYPAPALWGEVGPDGGLPRAYAFRLRDDHHWAQNVATIEVIRQAVVDVAAIVWEDLERDLAWRRLPTCVTPGCQRKAPMVFTVDWRSTGAAVLSAIAAHIGHPELEPGRTQLCGRTWAPGDEIRLCPEHAHHVYRGEDPARPGVLRDDLVPDVWAAVTTRAAR